MGVGGQQHALVSVTTRKTRYPLYRRLGGPQDRSGRLRQISPPQGFVPRTVQPVASVHTDCASPVCIGGKIVLNSWISMYCEMWRRVVLYVVTSVSAKPDATLRVTFRRCVRLWELFLQKCWCLASTLHGVSNINSGHRQNVKSELSELF